jgi:hypothetical protein
MACRMERLITEAADEDGSPRGRMVAYYMEHFGMMYPEAVAMLEQESKLRWRGALEAVASLYGLDEDDAISHVLTYGVNQPERIQ